MQGFILIWWEYLPVRRVKTGRVDIDGDSVPVNQYKKRGLFYEEIPNE